MVLVGACTTAENRADLVTKALYTDCASVSNGTVWRWTEAKHAMDGEKEDGQDEGEQRRAAVQTISDLGQKRGGVVEALGMCEVTGTLD